MPTSSCDADPISYYRQLHEQIKTRVEATQREQAEALTNLRSRFARQLVAEESHSTASSVAAESTQSRRQVEESHQRQTTTTTTHVHQAQTTVTAAEEVQQDRMDTLRDYAESNDSSSISRALLRPQNPALFDLND
jgi:hypothetical protein